jgi:hypothetical protein
MFLENPHLTPLLLLVLVPLLLQILERRGAQVVVWPATRFLMLAPKARLRRLRLRETAILLTRTLAVLAVVLAVLRPSPNETTPGARSLDRLPRATILIVDTSYSMEYQAPGASNTNLDRARSRALKHVRASRPGDEILLITSAGHWLAYRAPSVASDTVQANDNRVERELSQLRCGPGRFRLTKELERTAALAGKLLNPRKEVLVLSDFQSDTLVGAEPRHIESFRTALAGASGNVELRWLDCGTDPAHNRFLSNAPPLRLAVDPHRDTQLSIDVSTTNHDENTEPPPTISVALRLGDEIVAKEERALDTPTSVTCNFSTRLPSGGTLPITFELDGKDGLPADDRHYVAVDVPTSIPVLVIAEPRGGQPRGEAEYVSLALYPAVPGRPPPRVPFRPEFRSSLESVKLDDYPVVIFCGFEALTPESVPRLEDYVRSGGGLAFFGGRNPPLPAVIARLFLRGSGVLPAVLEGVAPSLAEGPLYPADVDTSHPFLKLFASPENGDLGKVPFGTQRHATQTAADARILATLGGTPWLLEKTLGKGRVVLLTTGVTPADSDFPRLPLFVPFIHRLTRYLAGATPTAFNVLLGESLAWSVAEPVAEFHAAVVSPDETRHDVDVTAGLTPGRIELRFDSATQPGHYRMELKESGRDLRSQTFAVNVPAYESDLRRAPKAELDAIAGRLGSSLNDTADATSSPLDTVPTPRPYWAYALATAVALFFLEQFLIRTFDEGG